MSDISKISVMDINNSIDVPDFIAKASKFHESLQSFTGQLSSINEILTKYDLSLVKGLDKEDKLPFIRESKEVLTSQEFTYLINDTIASINDFLTIQLDISKFNSKRTELRKVKDSLIKASHIIKSEVSSNDPLNEFSL